MVRVQRVVLELGEPYYTEIGAILHKWATLEYLLQNIIWRAMGLDNKKGRVLTLGMGINTLLGVLRNLPRRWINDKTITAQLGDLIREVSLKVEMRNHLSHGIWTVDPDDASQTPQLNYMKTGPDRITPGAEPITPVQLREFAGVVAILCQCAERLLQAVGGVDTPSAGLSQ